MKKHSWAYLLPLCLLAGCTSAGSFFLPPWLQTFPPPFLPLPLPVSRCLRFLPLPPFLNRSFRTSPPFSTLYHSYFKAVPSTPQYSRESSEFPSLKIDQRSFLSDCGQKLAGYVCSYEGVTPQGTILITHGLGVGGFSAYLNVADYFAKKGFLVFGFDITANGGSEGDSCYAIEQAVVDLSYAIDYVKRDAVMGALPLVLWGHSWGAYAVNTVLSVRPDVKAVISCASFDNPSTYFSYALTLTFQNFPAYLPYKEKIVERIRAIERQSVGAPYVGYSSLTGFANTAAKAMILGGEKDINVPNAIGYDLYQDPYSADPRFTFRSLPDRAHFDLYCTDAAREYVASYLESHPADPTTHQIDFSAYDKSKANELDTALMDQMVAFCQAACP
jgi:pimeloyl-ACP methyl ester carboxylesterase